MLSRTLTNYELTQKVISLQRQVCCCPDTPVDCEQVDVCLGISELGDPALFLNEQGDFVVAGGADSNFFSTNLVQNADRTHDAVTFGFIINGLTAGGVDWSLGVSNTGQYQFITDLGADTVTELITPTAYNITAVDGTNIATVQIEPELIEISSADAGDTSTIKVVPAGIQLNAPATYYLGDQVGGNLPPTEAAPDWILLVDAANGAIEKITPTDLGNVLGVASFGADNQVPFTNAAGTDFDYSPELTFDGLNLVVGEINIGDITVAGSTDEGVVFTTAATFDSGAFTELAGLTLSYAINTPQITTRDTTIVGGIFRLETRAVAFASGGQSFIVFGYPTGGSVATSRIIVSLQDGTTALTPSGGNLAVGHTSPQTNLHIIETSADTVPTVEVEQLSTGDAGLQFSIVGDSFAMGIDNSDNDLFKISYAATAGTAVLGTNDLIILSAAGALAINGSLQVDAIVNDTGLAAGVYTPTRSAEANMDANVTTTEAQYMRVGNTVTVSGRFTADPTLTATITSFEITLPVASNIGATEDAAGVAFCGSIAGMGAEVTGSVANNTALIRWVSTDVTSQTWAFTFSYQVI